MPPENTPDPTPAAKAVLRHSPLGLGLDTGPINRWALVVGVSRYKRDTLNLKYAADDARQLCEVLESGQCGHFSGVQRLIDADATTIAVTQSLRSFFRRAAANDMVLLYFSCHGGADPKGLRRDLMYLLTHDTDPDDIAGTALRMDEINRSLEDYVQAQRKLIFLDTCHSGYAGAVGAKAGAEQAGSLVDFLQRHLSVEGVGWLTSAEAGEVSFEDKRWGGGHGVFTHYVLEGLRGAADGYPDPKTKDGIVTIDELFEYVRAKVRDDELVRRAQNPRISISGSLRHLPLAYTGGVDAHRLVDLATDLDDLGRRDGERLNFLAAAERFTEAIRVAQGRHPEAEAGCGRALLAGGLPADAAAVLWHLLDRAAGEAPPSAWLDLGLAEAQNGHRERAAEALAHFVTVAPGDPSAAFAKAYAAFLSNRTTGRRRALLIGIDVYREPSLPQFHGCVNDVTLMHDVLLETLGFGAEDIELLTDAQATRAAMRAALRRLVKSAELGDLVLVHFSGLAIPDDNPMIRDSGSDAFLFAHDTRLADGHIQNALGFEEVHRTLTKLRSQSKVLLLDAPVQARFVRLAEDKGDYALWTAARENTITVEDRYQLRGEEVQGGLFTGALADTLRATPEPAALTNGDLLAKVRSRVAQRRPDQLPQLVADPAQPFLAQSRLYEAMWAFAQRRSYHDLDAADIGRHYQRYGRLVDGPFPAWHASVGRAFAEHRDFEPAVRALKKALAQSTDNPPDLLLDLGRAQLGARDFAGAVDSFRRYGQAVAETAKAAGLADDGGGPRLPAEAWIAQIRRLAKSGRHALLIGVETHAATVPNAPGAANDVAALRAVLESDYGFAAADIAVLVNEQATRAAIQGAVTGLADRVGEGSALLFFAGNGSSSGDGDLTVLPQDARYSGTRDIAFGELRQWLGRAAEQAVVVVDAGWAQPVESDKSYRHVPPDMGAQRFPSTRDFKPAGIGPGAAARPAATAAASDAIVRQIDQQAIRLGGVTILNGSVRFETSGSLPPLLSPDIHDGQPGGVLTGRLVQRLKVGEPANLTYRRWTEPLAGEADLIPPLVIGPDLDASLFAPAGILAPLQSSIEDHLRQPLVALSDKLAQWVRAEALPPRYEVNRGILNLAIGRAEEGRASLSRAVQALDEPDEPAAAPATGIEAALAEECEWAAHHFLGYAHLSQGIELGIGVDMLRWAHNRRPDEPRTAYFLGRAILELLEQDQVREAEALLQHYLDRGAPLGDRERVDLMLQRLRATARNLAPLSTSGGGGLAPASAMPAG